MRIGVIMGGISKEREVSLKSGEEVIKYLNRDKYKEVKRIIINSKIDAINKIKDIDFAFLALHGKFGEDGTIQGILEALGIPYSGCDLKTSAICMDKNISKRLLRDEGIRTGKHIILRSSEAIPYNKIEEIGYPIFIKPNSGGSSIATFLVKRKEEVLKAVEEVLKCDCEVMLEEYIKGFEIASFVLNGDIFPTVSIETKKGEFFDYKSKYDKGYAEEKIIDLEENIKNEVNNFSKIIWDILGCKGYIRVDMIVSKDRVYVLEINTLPGLTSTSIIPKSAMGRGISFSELLDKLIEASL